MTDFKSMYYHLAGRMATTVEVLEMTVVTLEGVTNALQCTTSALNDLTEKLKNAQLTTEEMFISVKDDNLDN